MVGPEISRRLPYREGLKVTYYQVLSAGTLAAMSVFINYTRRRPLSSSMVRHIAAAALGLYAGLEVDRFVEYKRNSKVVVIEDYIRRHPEDFPPAAPKKYKDILLPWTPVR